MTWWFVFVEKFLAGTIGHGLFYRDIFFLYTTIAKMK